MASEFFHANQIHNLPHFGANDYSSVYFTGTRNTKKNHWENKSQMRVRSEKTLNQITERISLTAEN